MARLKTHTVEVDGLEIPAELRDVDHPIWADDALYRAWLAEWGFGLDVTTKMGVDPPPARRRNHAAAEWGSEVGIVNPEFPAFPDFHRLTETGVYGTR